VKRAIAIILLSAASAYACDGVYVAEAGFGFAGGALCGAAGGLTARGLGEDGVAGGILAGTLFVGGTAAAVWLAGEDMDGPSENGWASFGGALGGSAMGATVGGGLIVLGMVAGDREHGPVGLPLVILGCATAAFAPAILSTVFYNVAKKPAPAEGAAINITPSIAALSPRGRDGAPTLAYGFAVSF
jgi:hypothetical protein